ncbi:MAG: TIGR04013 family B12-binding domain/radical SAM domain-containing protein [Byssovorax sp.]
MPAPVFVAHHARTGIAALNVITAALGADPRTSAVPVRFAKDREALAEAIAAERDRGRQVIAGWSFYSTDFARSADDLAWVRARTEGAGAIHLAGGVHATAEPEETLRAGFDRVAIGEGEATITSVFAALLGGRDPWSGPGIARLDRDGRMISHGPGERLPLDAYPAFNLAHRKFNAIEITRGCVYACRFCQTPYMFKARFRHRSVGDVAAHARALREADLSYIRFVSPTSLSYGSEDTSVNLAAVEALLAAVREAMGPEGKIYFGTFPSEVRPEHVTAEALRILRRYVDNDNLVIGAQSGSQRVLDATRRDHTVDDVIRAVTLCKEAGFGANVDFLLGLPGETEEDRRLSLDLAERLASGGAKIHSHAFLPLPGTPLADREPEALGEETALAMARMESRGAMYGQWRRQVVAAEELVGRRRRRPR